MASTVDTPAQQPRPPPLPRYRTPAGEAVCRRMYDAALAVLPYPHDEILASLQHASRQQSASPDPALDGSSSPAHLRPAPQPPARR